MWAKHERERRLFSIEKDSNKTGFKSVGPCKKKEASTNEEGSVALIEIITENSPSHEETTEGEILTPQLTSWENPEIEKKKQIKKVNIFLYKTVK